MVLKGPGDHPLAAGHQGRGDGIAFQGGQFAPVKTRAHRRIPLDAAAVGQWQALRHESPPLARPRDTAGIKQLRRVIGANHFIGLVMPFNDEPVTAGRVHPPLAHYTNVVVAIKHVMRPLLIRGLGRIGHGFT